MRKFGFYLIFILQIAFAIKAFAIQDTLFMTNGEKLACKIFKEDSINYYFKIWTNGENVEINVQKVKVKSVFYKKNNLIAPLETSYVNLGLGLGPSYGGILGTQVLIGKNNSGIILGLGNALKGHLGLSIGVQGAFKWFFVNLGYGPSGVYRYNNDPWVLNKGIYANFGGMIRLDKQKKWFLAIGLGFTNGIEQRINSLTSGTYEYFNYRGSLGIGYRIGK